ncbi:glycine betaine ABC transporter substrate-binding protein [Kineosporia sp. J2-2]|uniref:Glycine betaine ABC transporter substrate-binding protein n=1 Tax=Kineosporia corallincola TaxID=2835133 RepID=A0ABS5TKG9_9ACTN|nr:glycine betaine ABC transporter substrate-binding protein [Kineosporia corallincola]MBT0771576.1 glycine betaine ABC transporter substrate-binding protein [Kineosporia corallincola]
MTSTFSRRALLGGLLAATTAGVAACSGETAQFSGGSGSGSKSGGDDGDNKTVSMAIVAGWDECVASSNLWKVLLEQRGYTVNLQELDIASTFTGVANGQIDLYLDAWLPATHEDYWNRYEDDLEKLGTWTDGTLVLSVPEYVDLSSIAELKDHKDDFGGRIVGIEAGAGEMKVARESIMPNYGLDDWTLVEGSTSAMLAELQKSITRKENVAVTLWTPHWAFGKYPIKNLDDPDGAWGEADQLTTVATKGFSEANPEVAGWLKNYSIEDDVLATLMSQIQAAGSGSEADVAQQWAQDNADVTDAWFGESTSSSPSPSAS